jgi:hypothetical protein
MHKIIVWPAYMSPFIGISCLCFHFELKLCIFYIFYAGISAVSAVRHSRHIETARHYFVEGHYMWKGTGHRQQRENAYILLFFPCRAATLQTSSMENSSFLLLCLRAWLIEPSTAGYRATPCHQKANLQPTHIIDQLYGGC